MPEKKFSELPSAANLTGDELAALSQMQSGSLASVKSTLQAIANWFAVYAQYTTALQTTDKTIAGAINELKQLISLIPQFSIEVVEELPTEDISDTTIYLVPAEDPEVGNYYEEYIYVNNTWELVGTTTVDLSAYYTKLEVDGLLATKANAAEVTAALATKENKSDMPTDVRTIIKDCKTPKNATITNGIAQFDCIEENLVKGLKVTMNPIQDLHGYDHPWAGGAGKNIFEPISGTKNAVVFTPQTDGTVKIQGTSSSSAWCSLTRKVNLSDLPVSIGDTLYLLGDGSNLVGVEFYQGTTRLSFKTTASSDSIVVPEYTDAITFLMYASTSSLAQGTAIDTTAYYCVSKTQVSSWTPYENICPISGRTEASITRTAGEDVETHTHQYGQTVYGGSDDFVSGGATVNTGFIEFDGSNDESWTTRTTQSGYTIFEHTLTNCNIASSTAQVGLCNEFPWKNDLSIDSTYRIQVQTLSVRKDGLTLEQFKTFLSNNNLQITYPLATPTTIQTSAEEITTVEGTNIISGTEPISECKYTELATVDDLIKIIGGQ